jgi:hypothetical protein
MVKEKRTKKDLETTILACCIARDLDVQRVVVWPTKTFGWYAGFAAAPRPPLPASNGTNFHVIHR